MEAIRDPFWRRLLVSFRTVERFDASGRSWTILAPPPGRARNERFRYMLLVSEATRDPVLALSLEADILGDWVAAVLDAGGRAILARFDSEPDFETWRELAMTAAWDRLAGPAGGAGAAPRGSRVEGEPRYP